MTWQTQLRTAIAAILVAVLTTLSNRWLQGRLDAATILTLSTLVSVGLAAVIAHLVILVVHAKWWQGSQPPTETKGNP